MVNIERHKVVKCDEPQTHTTQYRPIRVLHFIGSLDIGGEQRYMVRIANRLDPARFQQIVVYCYGLALLKELNSQVQTVKILGRKTSFRRTHDWVASYTFFRSFMTLLREQNIDLVATHCTGIQQLMGMVAAKRCGKPVVHTIQRTFGCHSRTEDAIIRSPGLRQVVYSLTDRFVALGSYYAQDQIMRWKIPREKVSLNYIGIDLDEYRPNPQAREEVRREFGWSPQTPVIGVVARHSPEKGIGRGITCFAHLQARLPEARLLLVGDGPTRADHEAQVQALGLQEAVVFAGARTDSARLLNGCDVMMQTGFNPFNGIVSIEALATGKPVVTVVENDAEEQMATDTCVEDRNGLLFRLMTPNTPADKLCALLQNRSLMDRMGQESRRMAEERFDIRRHILELEALYESLVRNGPRKQAPSF